MQIFINVKGMFVVSSKLLIYKYWIEQNLSMIILSKKSRQLIVNVVHVSLLHYP